MRSCRNFSGAFTLAEVLITLGIIGVVAALTMPSLIQKHQEQVTVNKLKKFYSVMSNAQLMAIKDNGVLDEWNVPDGWTKESVTIFADYFKPYLNIVKNCGTDPGCLGYNNVKRLSGSEYIVNYDADERYYKFILNDGSHIILRPTSQGGQYCNEADGGASKSCGSMWIDINGKKAPNTIGRDIFTLNILRDRLVPSKTDDCYIDSNGFGCFSYILKNGNMDYLHKKD